MMMRQYFMSLKILGLWSKWGKSNERHWKSVHKAMHTCSPVVDPAPQTRAKIDGTSEPPALHAKPTQAGPLTHKEKEEAEFLDDSDDEHFTNEPDNVREAVQDQDRKLRLMRQVMNKWRRLAHIQHPMTCDTIKAGEFQADWTRAIAPRVDGRINIVGVTV